MVAKDRFERSTFSSINLLVHAAPYSVHACRRPCKPTGIYIHNIISTKVSVLGKRSAITHQRISYPCCHQDWTRVISTVEVASPQQT